MSLANSAAGVNNTPHKINPDNKYSGFIKVKAGNLGESLRDKPHFITLHNIQSVHLDFTKNPHHINNSPTRRQLTQLPSTIVLKSLKFSMHSIKPFLCI